MERFLPENFPAVISVKIIPQKPKTQIVGILNDGRIKIHVAATPEKGKANSEIIKFFWKKYKLRATITSGKTSGKKNISLEKESE
jgi:uncharacterized protein (TIGR00251 family)